MHRLYNSLGTAEEIDFVKGHTWSVTRHVTSKESFYLNRTKCSIFTKENFMKNIAVYCGSGSGKNPAYTQAAQLLGQKMSDRGYGLVYGGGDVGLMGTIADAVITNGKDVIGVIPQALYDLEVAHLGLTELLVVDTMHERKALMMKHADAFVAMPGGIGTLEELFEVLTWFQLKFHQKPIGVLNVNGYYDQLLGFVQHAVAEGFIRENIGDLLVTASEPAELICLLEERAG